MHLFQWRRAPAAEGDAVAALPVASTGSVPLAERVAALERKG